MPRGALEIANTKTYGFSPLLQTHVRPLDGAETHSTPLEIKGRNRCKESI